MSTARLRDSLGPSGDTEESHLLRLIADAVVVIWNVSQLLLMQSGVTNQQIQLAYLHDQMVAHRGPVCECCTFQKSSSTTLDLSFTKRQC